MAANSDTTQKNMPLSDVRTPETRSNTPAVIGGEKHSPTPPDRDHPIVTGKQKA